MNQASTWNFMPPERRRVAGESLRVRASEEPDGGNLLVRIWRGPRSGNRPGLLDQRNADPPFWPSPRERCPRGIQYFKFKTQQIAW